MLCLWIQKVTGLPYIQEINKNLLRKVSIINPSCNESCEGRLEFLGSFLCGPDKSVELFQQELGLLKIGYSIAYVENLRLSRRRPVDHLPARTAARQG